MMSFLKRIKNQVKEGVDQVSKMTPKQQREMLQNDPLYSPEVIGGFTMPVKKIHPEDAKRMMGFIDYVRLRQPANKGIELDASRIAEHYGTSMPKTRAGLANTFDEILSRMRQKR